MNEVLLQFAQWVDSHAWSTSIHESYYLYAWIETTHVLTLALFLGMLAVIDLRMLGLAFINVRASTIAARLDRPMLIGFVVMVASGLLLYYAIPVRTTTSVWFRIKVVMLVAAGINALLFRSRMQKSVDRWDLDPVPPGHIRIAAGLSLAFWACVVFAGRAIAYDWFDCHKPLPAWLATVAGCLTEYAAQAG